MNRYKKYGKGWYNESHRHSLARKGIKTKTDLLSESQFIRKYGYRPTMSDIISEGYYREKKKIDYIKIDKNTISNLKKFLHNKFTKAVPDHLEENPKVKEAQSDIQKIEHPSKLKEWAIKHKNTLTLLGLGGTAAILGTVAGVPTLMQNIATGEIVAVGGTLLGRTGQITGMVLTGMGVMEEAKVIRKEVYGEEPISLKEFEVVSPKPKAFIVKVRQKEKPIHTSNFAMLNTPESLAEISSQPIPYHKLTKEERDSLLSAVKKVKNLLGKKGKSIKFNEKNLQVVKRVGPDDSAFGAHQDKLIQIDRDILKDRDKTEGVLLHECIHKVYDVRDETRELENLHIDYLGLAM